MTQKKIYNPTDVVMKIGNTEFNGFANGTYIEIIPHTDNPYFNKNGEEVTIELSLDFNYSHRKWMEYYLGIWESNDDTENN